MLCTTRKIETQIKYTPSFGLVTSHQVTLAIEEFSRLGREGQDHGRVLVAQRVLLAKWRNSKIYFSFGKLRIEADYEDVKVTKKTRADLYISKLPGFARYGAF